MSGIHLVALSMPGALEWLVIGAVGLLIFGRRLPDVARSIGRSIVEFKRGMRDVKDELDRETRDNDRKLPPEADRPGGSS